MKQKLFDQNIKEKRILIFSIYDKCPICKRGQHENFKNNSRCQAKLDYVLSNGKNDHIKTIEILKETGKNINIFSCLVNCYLEQVLE